MKIAVTCLGLLLAIFPPHTLADEAEAGLSCPEAKNDGLATSSPESEGVASKPLRDMEAAIRGGEFKKIGSVLVARHGKLVYGIVTKRLSKGVISTDVITLFSQ